MAYNFVVGAAFLRRIMNRLNYFCKLPVDLILNLALEEKKMNFSIFFLTGKMNLYFYFSKYDEFLTANNMASTSTMWQSELHGGLHAWPLDGKAQAKLSTLTKLFLNSGRCRSRPGLHKQKSGKRKQGNLIGTALTYIL